jgi:hypothetical protein
MSQKEIELILARQLAEYLAGSIFIVDPGGTLVFYNEPAEKILGRRFGETGEMSADVWSTLFEPIDEAGEPIASNAMALMVTVNERRPAHQTLWIRGLDQVKRHVEVTSFPLIGQVDRYLGAIAIFWEIEA